jgi:hypothetical protein
MTIKKLFELLKLVKNVTSNRWDDVLKIVKIMSSIEVKEKEWNNKYKRDNPEWNPLDLSKIETWIAIDRKCIELDFNIETNKLICKANIYRFEIFENFRRLNFTATLIMPDEFIQEIEYLIIDEVNNLAKEAYEEHLKKQKELWISNFKSEMLKE